MTYRGSPNKGRYRQIRVEVAKYGSLFLRKKIIAPNKGRLDLKYGSVFGKKLKYGSLFSRKKIFAPNKGRKFIKMATFFSMISQIISNKSVNLNVVFSYMVNSCGLVNIFSEFRL